MSYELRLGDALDPIGGLASLPDLAADVVITDPVWPNRPASMWPDVDAGAVFGAACEQFNRVCRRRLVVIVGCDTDPRFLACVPPRFPFVRTCWLRYALPSYNGTILNSGVVAYVFGDRKGPHGATLLPGESTSSRSETWLTPEDRDHPCPRKEEHMMWLVRFFTDPGELIVDPFAGSGTTGVAALRQGRRFLGWERDADYHSAALKRLGRAREQLEMCA